MKSQSDLSKDEIDMPWYVSGRPDGEYACRQIEFVREYNGWITHYIVYLHSGMSIMHTVKDNERLGQDRNTSRGYRKGIDHTSFAQ